MTDLFRQYCKDESGATAIEYGLCCMILLAALISIMGTGGAVDNLYQKLAAIVTALG
ncbi:MAG: Flp family type IVb pilin [Alphaproteobacteria bacterium]|nr:MAG: Flp family type IVb pilin [Alphaproteobacteria bacterium]